MCYNTLQGLKSMWLKNKNYAFLVFFIFSSCSLFDNGKMNIGGDNASLGNGVLPATGEPCQVDYWSVSGLAPCNACPQDAQSTANNTYCECDDVNKCFDSSSGTCIDNPCTGNTWFFSGACTPCPASSTVNSNNTGCVCTDAGMTFEVSSNTCVVDPTDFDMWYIL